MMQTIIKRLKDPRPIDCILILFLMSGIALVLSMIIAISELFPKLDCSRAIAYTTWVFIVSGAGLLSCFISRAGFIPLSTSLGYSPWHWCCNKNIRYTKAQITNDTEAQEHQSNTSPSMNMHPMGETTPSAIVPCHQSPTDGAVSESLVFEQSATDIIQTNNLSPSKITV